MKITMIAIIERECPRLYKILKLAFIHKNMTLCVTSRFYTQKARHFAKSKTIYDTFLYTKTLTLCVTRFFIGFLKFAEGGGHLFIEKQCTLRDICILKKQCTLRYVDIYTKNKTLCATF